MGRNARSFSRLRAIVPVLARHCGPSWPLALARALWRSRGLIGRTRWTGRGDDEALLARRLVLLPAVALELRARLGERAPAALREIVLGALEARRRRAAAALPAGDASDPCAIWHTLFEQVQQGVGAFNETECLSVERERFHVRVRRCLFAELASDLALPDLARGCCDAAGEFHGRLLPGYEFNRAGSQRHSLAYGHPFCEYVWELSRRARGESERSQEPPAQESGDAEDAA